MSVGLYHTAGKGTRLAPLPGAENNNKPGVKLPASVDINGEPSAITILESVTKQTGCYAKSRHGRLSVFWGDQIFVPTVSVEYKASHHIDILCSLGPMPTAEVWKEKGNQNYGLVARSASGKSAQVEKVDHATATKMLAGLGKIDAVGPSLGSFSVSSSMLLTLLEEFKTELSSRKGKLDSDPHLWMPMTLQLKDYISLMEQKGIKADESEKHFKRIEIMMSKFNSDSGNASLGLFGPVDVGQDLCWWDYGLLRLYQRNVLLMSEKSEEADLMRLFFNMGSTLIKDSSLLKTDVDSNSLVANCQIGGNDAKPSGSIKNSVLCNVKCRYIDAEGCILINVTADSIIARPGCIIYNIIDTSTKGLDLPEKEVLVSVFTDNGDNFVMKSSTTIDGGKAWEQKLEFNSYTFEEVYNMNANADPTKLEGKINAKHKKSWVDLQTNNSSGQSYWFGFTTGVIAGLGVLAFSLLFKKGSK